MHRCIRRLLTNPDEEAIECLCRLLSTIGKDLDTPKNSDIMNSYFKNVEDIARQRLSNRIRFMVKGVSELRSREWKPRHEEFKKTE
jgi:translation initiation factor 4G